MDTHLSLAHYREILEEALRLGFKAWAFGEYRRALPDGRTMLIRHDLDVALEPAHQVRAIEAELGVPATYFVRVHATGYNSFSWDALRFYQTLAIDAEIGLHSEAPLHVAAPGGDPIPMLRREKQALEAALAAAVRGVSFHLPKQAPGHVGVEGIREAGFDYVADDPVFNQDRTFVSDSNAIVKPACPCELLADPTIHNLYLQIHPVWWTTPPHDVAGILGRLRQDR